MEKEFRDYSLFVARVIMGLIFATAGTIKISDPFAFAEIISRYKILPEYLINDVAFFLPYLELFIASMFFSGLFIKGASILSFAILITFTGALIYNISRGINISCGCFTSTIEQVTDIHQIYYIIRDIIFISINFYIVKNVFRD